MSDQDATNEPTGTQDAPQAPEKPAATPPWGSADDFNPEKAWNLIQNLRGDLDKAKSAQQRLKELEDKDKTEAQRLAEERDTFKTKATEVEGELLRLRVGLAKGLTEAQARRLVGSTQEELEADADELLETFGSTGGTSAPPSRRPTERLRGGGEPDAEPEPDLRKIAADIPRR